MNNNNGVLEFKLEFKKWDVQIRDETTGKVIHYELREMMADQRDQYLNDLNKRTKFDNEGKVVGMSNFVGWHAQLLTRTLFKVKEVSTSGEEQVLEPAVAVTEAEVKKWPASLSSRLFKHAQELSRLDEEEDKVKKLETEAKNE